MVRYDEIRLVDVALRDVRYHGSHTAGLHGYLLRARKDLTSKDVIDLWEPHLDFGAAPGDAQTGLGEGDERV